MGYVTTIVHHVINMIHHTPRDFPTLSEKLRKLRKPSFSLNNFEVVFQLTLLRKQIYEESKTKIVLYVL